MKPPIILQRGKTSFLVDKFEGELHTHVGKIQLSELKNKKFGETVTTHLGYEYRILPFRPIDFFKHFKRTATPIMPKDIGAIIVYTGLSPDSLILDVGTGTGLLAAYLAYFNKFGKVVTVEKRVEFAKIARRNFKLAKLKNVYQIIGDIDSIIHSFKIKFDLAVVDVKNDYKLIPHIKKILRNSGFLVVYNPYLEPARRVYDVMQELGFSDLEFFEIMKVDYDVKKVGTRAVTRVWHTGYLTIGRKID